MFKGLAGRLARPLGLPGRPDVVRLDALPSHTSAAAAAPAAYRNFSSHSRIQRRGLTGMPRRSMAAPSAWKSASQLANFGPCASQPLLSRARKAGTSFTASAHLVSKRARGPYRWAAGPAGPSRAAAGRGGFLARRASIGGAPNRKIYCTSTGRRAEKYTAPPRTGGPENISHIYECSRASSNRSSCSSAAALRCVYGLRWRVALAGRMSIL